ncbi:post-transcriptional regulator [Aliibacillus thermotolerans]|uniref:Post-transcriptional regulator n=1 Tax=Aliibacillus thermotolerans TaxID=1834418 RepID=A0ABW0UBW7_9BACI|nr:post-transcriptional regulator [Aliibacillus thermotolerans]
MDVTPFSMWREEVDVVLESKREEFALLGYTKATKEDIWNCVMEKLKKKEVSVRLHVLVNDILSLRLNEYMNKVTIDSYKEGSTFASNVDLNDLIEDIETYASNNRH